MNSSYTDQMVRNLMGRIRDADSDVFGGVSEICDEVIESLSWEVFQDKNPNLQVQTIKRCRAELGISLKHAIWMVKGRRVGIDAMAAQKHLADVVEESLESREARRSHVEQIARGHGFPF